MGIEKRREHRRHIIYYLQVLDPVTEEPAGRLVDITTMGMMMISETALEPGTSAQLRIMFPANILGSSSVDVVGKSVWCHKDVNPDHYAVGFQFDDVTEDQSRQIRQLIDRYGFID